MLQFISHYRRIKLHLFLDSYKFWVDDNLDLWCLFNVFKIAWKKNPKNRELRPRTNQIIGDLVNVKITR